MKNIEKHQDLALTHAASMTSAKRQIFETVPFSKRLDC